MKHDGEEMEVIAPQEFMAKIEEIVQDPDSLVFDERSNILALFENPTHATKTVTGMVLYRDVADVF